jgi:hypothetical protein
MSRIYGKPEETVRQVEVNPATAVLKGMSLDEELELLRQLQRGELADTAPASPIVRSGSTSAIGLSHTRERARARGVPFLA